MPVYEYECKSCNSRFDKVQPFTAEPLTECEVCGKGPVRRVFQPVGVIFKGSGWYITDSRKSESASTPPKSTSSDTATKSDDAKPAVPSESSTPAAPAKPTTSTSNTAPAD